MTELQFAPMGLADVDAVAAAEQRIHPFPWTLGNFQDSLDAGYSAWIARRDEAMVGYGLLMMAIDEASLLNISIESRLQRSGLGSQLMAHLIGVARSLGAIRMLLEVRRSNESGRGLYGKFGFQQIGVRRGYYATHEGREDALVMSREL